MVVTSGDESIVRYNRAVTVGLRVVGSVCILIGVVSVGAALLGEVTWEFSLRYGVTSVYLAVLLFPIARSFSRSFVAIGPEGVRLGLLKRGARGGKWAAIWPWPTWSLLPEQRYKWEEIGHVTYDSSAGICRFRACDTNYELTDADSPSPRTVAKLLAERKGVQLPAQESLAPPGKKQVPDRTWAAISGGISIPLTAAAVAGALWIHSPDGKFEAVVGFGLPGMICLVSAILLFIRAKSHTL
jgi:hypothetical protein